MFAQPLDIQSKAQRYMRDQVANSGFGAQDFLETSVAWAAGAFYPTVEDLFRWSEGLANEKLLSKESLKQMFQVYPETARDGKHYGYGVVLSEQFGQPPQYHGGGINGFATAIQRYPKSRVCVVVMSNVESIRSWDVATGLASLLLDEREPGHWPLIPERTSLVRGPEYRNGD